MFSGLAILGNTSFKFTSTRRNDEDGAISLSGSGDHVLDKITMSRGIDDGNVVFLGLELHQLNIDGDTSFTFSLQFVQYPSILEGSFPSFLGFLLVLFDHTFVDTSTFVDHVTSTGRLSGVDMSNYDDVDVSQILSFRHFDGCLSRSNLLIE